MGNWYIDSLVSLLNELFALDPKNWEYFEYQFKEFGKFTAFQKVQDLNVKIKNQWDYANLYKNLVNQNILPL